MKAYCMFDSAFSPSYEIAEANTVIMGTFGKHIISLFSNTIAKIPFYLRFNEITIRYN